MSTAPSLSAFQIFLWLSDSLTNSKPYVFYYDTLLVTWVVNSLIAAGIFLVIFVPFHGVAWALRSFLWSNKAKALSIPQRKAIDIVNYVFRLIRGVALIAAAISFTQAINSLSIFDKLPVWLTIFINHLLLLAVFLHWNRRSDLGYTSPSTAANTAAQAEKTAAASQDLANVELHEQKFTTQLAMMEESTSGSFSLAAAYGVPADGKSAVAGSAAIAIDKSAVATKKKQQSISKHASADGAPILEHWTKQDHVMAYFRSVAFGLVHHPIRSVLSVFVIVAYCVIVGILTCYACAATNPSVINFWFQRNAQGYSSCKENSVCFAYLTVAPDLSSQMILNFQVNSYRIPGNAYAQLNSTTDAANNGKQFKAHCFKMDFAEIYRFQCFAEITGLQGSSVYTVLPTFTEIHEDTSIPIVPIVYKKTLKFRTGPAPGDAQQQVTFVSGGDVQWSTAGIALAKEAAKQEPLFAITAGDIAYENSMSRCYRRFEDWFNYWETHMTTPTGFSVPILTCVGNHEAGGFFQPRYNDFFYLRYFPHDLISTLGNNTEKYLEMDPQEYRATHHFHKISDHTAIMMLDSVVHDTAEDQMPYIKDTWAANTGIRNKIVTHHGAVYPSKLFEFLWVYSEVRKWEPLFDQFNVSLVLENHYHAYKLTSPIRGGQVVSSGSGTVYAGDGAWGVVAAVDLPDEPRLNPDTKIKARKMVNNIWLVKASNTGMQVNAITYDLDSALVSNPYPGSQVTF